MFFEFIRKRPLPDLLRGEWAEGEIPSAYSPNAADMVTDSRYSEESGAHAMSEILARKRDRHTPVFGANDMLAVGAMVFARSAGLSVPGDIAITGFDDIPAAKLLGLTTVRQPEFDLGAFAARTLVERLQPCGLKPPGQSLELKFEIMKRSSA